MLRFVLSFAVGVLVFHQLHRLPSGYWLPIELALLLLLVWRMGWVGPLAGLALGFFWSHFSALATEPARLPFDSGVVAADLRGRIVSLPQRSGDVSRFVFLVDSVAGVGPALHGQWRVRLSWRDPPAIHPGDVWQLPVRLRAAHGYASPGAWDYEGWLYWQGIRYTGYVRADGEPIRRDQETCCWLTRLRGRLAAAIDAMDATPFARGVIRAVTLGDRSGLGPTERALFQATGTSHLMAISGLHIGLVAALGLGGANWAWRRSAVLSARAPSRVVGAIVGLVLAGIYAALAGLGLPTQRALIMLLALAMGLLLRREGGVLHPLALAAFAVLLWHPPSILTAGFWLSFSAVLVILAVLRLRPRERRWRQAIRIQLALSVALFPLLALFGLPVSIAAPLVNLLLVPVFGLLVVPLSLLGVFLSIVSPVTAEWVLAAVAWLLDWVRVALALFTGPGWGTLAPPGDTAALAVAVLGLLLLGAPPGNPLRRLALPLLLVLGMPREPRLAPGEFGLSILDVGQGASAVVETHSHLLVFDTGPGYRSGFSTASAVLLPFLRQRGVKTIDRLVLSHGDSDHAGGVKTVLRELAVKAVISGEPDRVAVPAVHCVAGEVWHWDGVRFEFLHPPEQVALRGNNASCVLRVSNAGGAVLLTGDIEAGVERKLVRHWARDLASEVVLAPHHGSRSSSTTGFIRATRPDYVVYSAGWANRYDFPNAEVVARWQRSGAVSVNTTTAGTIGFRFAADGGVDGPEQYRTERKRFWRHAAGSAGAAHAVSSRD